MEVTQLHERTDHVILFNKFALRRHHLLVISRHFEAQTSPITRNNFSATLEAMRMFEDQGRNWLAFYNCGKDAGASQPHRHFQMIPFSPNGIPIETTMTAGPGRALIPAYKEFQHYFVRFNDFISAELLHHNYVQAVSELPPGCDSYNVLFTLRWFLLIPRASESAHGVSMNSLAFAGCIMMRGEAEFADWLQGVEKPIAGLKQMTFPK